jgi:hypothetical protein
MGTFRVTLQVGSPVNGLVETVQALAGTGAAFTVAPASLLHRLGIDPVATVKFYIDNGKTVDYPTGWASFAAEGRCGMARVVFGTEDDCWVGATTLGDMLLAVDPVGQRLVPVEGWL